MTNYRSFKAIVSKHRDEGWKNWAYSDKVAALACKVIEHMDTCEKCRVVFDELYAGEVSGHKPLKDMETFTKAELWISCNTKQ